MVRSLSVVVAAALVVASGCSCESRAPTRHAGPQLEVRRFADGISPHDGTIVGNEETLDFGFGKIGRASSVRLALRNGGDGLMHLQDPVLERGSDFRLAGVLQPCGAAAGYEVEIGDCRTLAVEFAPTALGDASDVLVLRSDDGDAPERRIRLAGRGARGALQVCVSTAEAGGDGDLPLDQCSSADVRELSVNFGRVTIDSGDLRRRVQLTNTGPVELEIAGVRPGAGDPVDFGVDPADYRAVLAPGASETVRVVMKPSDVGARSGTVSVMADDPVTSPVVIHLQSAGDGPRLCLEPRSLEFGEVGVNRVAAPKQMQLQNCGTKPLQISAVELEGDPDFALIQPFNPAVVRAGEAVAIAVTLTPTGLGPKLGRVKITSSDPIEPVKLAPLRANGVAALECRLEAASSVLDFGAQAQGNQSTRTLVLHNAGAADCAVSSVAIDAAGLQARFKIAAMPPLPVTIPANGGLQISLAYNPVDANGPDQGQLTLVSNDPTRTSGELQVALRGTPTAKPECRLDIVPRASALPGMGRPLNFGVVGIGDRKKLLVTMKNVGTLDCRIESPKFGLTTDKSAFSFGAHNPALPSTLAPGAMQTIEVAFQPGSATSYEGMANDFTVGTSDGQASECTGFTGTGPAGCKRVSLSGTGVTLGIDVVPGALDFGVVTLGCNSSDKTVTVYNIGGAAVTLNGFSIDPAVSGFTIVGKPATPHTLNPGSSVAVAIRYRPQAAGRETATLVIAHSFSGGSTTIQLNGEGSTQQHQLDAFAQNAVPRTDVLWVIDNSGSMFDKQEFLSANAATFIQQANATNSDYQVAVTSMEWAGTNGPHTADGNSGFPGQALEAGAFFGNPKIIKRTDANPAAELQKNIKVGECCADDAESGLEAAKAALSNPLISDPTRPNSTFLRDDAKLAVIVLSDEEDQGGSRNVQYYVDFFQNLKGAKNTSLFAWHSIVGDSPNGCSSTVNGKTVAANAGKRYIEASTRTGGIVRSICTADWGRIASDIGLDAFAAKTQFFLTRTANVATLVVTVNGARQTPGANFDYDAATNSIVFRAGSIPGPGAAIKAEYDTLCL